MNINILWLPTVAAVAFLGGHFSGFRFAFKHHQKDMAAAKAKIVDRAAAALQSVKTDTPCEHDWLGWSNPQEHEGVPILPRGMGEYSISGVQPGMLPTYSTQTRACTKCNLQETRLV